MIVERSNLDPAEVNRLAEAWFQRQMAILEKAHGTSWPEHREWIADYLRSQIRQRLIELGWRRKR